jgi:hypothetical protein
MGREHGGASFALVSLPMTIGMARNNPWNLCVRGIPWEGLADVQPVDGPLVFKTLELGIRAGIKDCYAAQQQGNNTPLKFVTRYSPQGSGNPVTQYIENVCAWTGFGFSQSIDFHDTPTMMAWAHAIFRQEQGIDNGVTDEQINAAIAMADGD